MMNNTDKLEPNHFYHCYNRANGKQDLFIEPRNYLFFLRKFEKYVAPIAEIYCYCLMPNHYHFLIKIKGINILKRYFAGKVSPEYEDWPKLLSRQFSNFGNAYAKAFNKVTGRNGSLFSRPFKRKRIMDLNHLRKIVHYIHHNPVKARLSSKPEDYPHSSYHEICEKKSQIIQVEKVIDLFGDFENFKHVHQEPPEITGIT